MAYQSSVTARGLYSPPQPPISRLSAVAHRHTSAVSCDQKCGRICPNPELGRAPTPPLASRSPSGRIKIKHLSLPLPLKQKTRAVSLKQNRPGNLTRRRKLCSRRALRGDILACPRPAWHGEAGWVRRGGRRGLLPGDGADPG